MSYDQRDRVLNLRNQGLSFARIGQAMGTSGSGAHSIYQRHLACIAICDRYGLPRDWPMRTVNAIAREVKGKFPETPENVKRYLQQSSDDDSLWSWPNMGMLGVSLIRRWLGEKREPHD